MEVRKIKILFLIGGFGTGGKERQLAELIRGLDEEYFEIHLLIKSYGAHYLEEIRAKLTSLTILDRFHFGMKAWLDIRRVMKLVNPDVIHSWAEMTSIHAAVIRFTGFRKCRVIDGSIRMVGYNQGIVPKAQRWILNRSSDLVISNSLAGLQVNKVSNSKGRCIYNGFDTERVKSLPECDNLRLKLGIQGKYVVGMVARMDENKDWDTFFKSALTIVKHRSDVVFLVVGDGNLKNHFQDLTKAYSGNFIFTGLVNNPEEFINIFNIGVLSSYSEGISNSILEYYSLKKPVIASGRGGVPELVIDKITGLIFPVGDHEMLTECILTLLADEKLCDKLGNEAFTFLTANFSFHKMIRRYTECYEELITRN